MTTMTNFPKVAYEVNADDNGSCIVFATNSATARREGANELNVEWEDVNYCRRRPWLDAYVDTRKVPASVLVEAGWWFECSHCGCTITNDMTAEAEEKGLDLDAMGIVETQNAYYCSQTCEAFSYAELRLRKAQEAAFYE